MHKPRKAINCAKVLHHIIPHLLSSVKVFALCINKKALSVILLTNTEINFPKFPINITKNAYTFYSSDRTLLIILLASVTVDSSGIIT